MATSKARVNAFTADNVFPGFLIPFFANELATPSAPSSGYFSVMKTTSEPSFASFKNMTIADAPAPSLAAVLANTPICSTSHSMYIGGRLRLRDWRLH